MRRVSCIPSSDIALREAASAALATIDANVDPDEVEQLLHDLLVDRYPRVDVHRETAVARYHVEDDAWYVYRDGRQGNPRAEDPN